MKLVQNEAAFWTIVDVTSMIPVFLPRCRIPFFKPPCRLSIGPTDLGALSTYLTDVSNHMYNFSTLVYLTDGNLVVMPPMESSCIVTTSLAAAHLLFMTCEFSPMHSIVELSWDELTTLSRQYPFAVL